MPKTLDGKTIVLIGGTGSFGKAFLNDTLRTTTAKEIRIFSRDEQKQFDLKNDLAIEKHLSETNVTFYLGDVRDLSRLRTVFSGADVVIHSGAIKHVGMAEINPYECVKTNIEGTANVVTAALEAGVERVVALSTDKAVLPVNAYGASKLILEKLTVNGNIDPRNRGTILSVVRYANVLGSRGSVVPFFQKMKATGVLPITDPNMTRFSITLQQSVDLVKFALEHAVGGEIFVPKAPSYRIETIAEAIAPECERRVVGIRPGEKLAECMICREEAPRTLEVDGYYVVTPEFPTRNKPVFLEGLHPTKVADDFLYTSDNNSEWLTAKTLNLQPLFELQH